MQAPRRTVRVVAWMNEENGTRGSAAHFESVKARIGDQIAAIDTRRYFDLHPTPADTLDKVDPDAPRRQVAVLAALAWYLAEAAEPIPAASR